MTTNTTIKSNTNKTKIFSIMGAALLMTCLFAGFAQAADNSNVQQAQDTCFWKGVHEVQCNGQTGVLGVIQVRCPNNGPGGHTQDADLQACVNRFSPNTVTWATSLGECRKN